MKKLTYIALLMACFLSLAACGGRQPAPATEPEVLTPNQSTQEPKPLESDAEGELEMEQEHTEITMTVGDTVITAALDNSETTQAFLATLPRTLTMNRYGNREYYGRIEAISENGEAIADFENGDVTYYPAGPSFAVFFAGEDNSSQGGLIRMGKVTSDLSLFESLGETAEMRIEAGVSNG